MSAAHTSLSVPQNPTRVGFWARPLSYEHAVVAVVAALCVGIGLHFSAGYSKNGSSSGLLIFGAFLLMAALICGRIFRKNRIMMWITGIPMAIVTTVAMGIFALIGGIVPQSIIERLGVPSLWGSWPFLMVSMLLLANLIGSSARRCWPLSYVNFTYLTTHAGLSLTIIGAAVSSSMLDRSMLVLHENTPTQLAEGADGSVRKLPVVATLRKFELETFAPTLALVTVDSHGEMKLKPGSALTQTGGRESIGGFLVVTTDFLPRAVFTGETWKPVPWKSAGPAAKVEVYQAGKLIKSGWVSCGSMESPASILELRHGKAFAMPDPRPKKFLSEVEFKQGNRTWTEQIEVNKPAHIGGLDFYQVSYDDKSGAASEYSVIEIVEDKGIRLVYAGIFAMLAGCVLHLWNGIGGKK